MNREEFTPYGETSFGSYGRKRYRFTGKERDEESGLGYHEARYYAPWLARWTAADPSGIAGGVNQYAYCGGNPVKFVDHDGMDFTAAFDFRSGTVTLRATFLVNTESEARQLNRAADAYRAVRASYETWNVRFDITVQRVDRPAQGRNTALQAEARYQHAHKQRDPLVNFYRNAQNPAVPRTEVGDLRGADNYDGGRTDRNSRIVMHHHAAHRDLGEYTDAVKHEVAHVFGLDDRHDGERTGTYYLDNEITDYDRIRRARGTSEPRGADFVRITERVAQRIMDLVFDFDPSMRRPGNSNYIENTPDIRITSDLSGDGQFTSYRAMLAAISAQADVDYRRHEKAIQDHFRTRPNLDVMPGMDRK